jgi:AcrR family transcriptional regulator
MSSRGRSGRTERDARRERQAAMSESLEVWTRPDRGRRRPRYTRDEIAAVAIRIIDSEGLEELSMRRLASELGAGTMTLYHYVHNKDELLALVSDAIMAELLVPDGELPTGWREAITLIAHRSREAVRRHPWMLDVRDDPAPGPNGVRHWDQSMQAVASLDISVGERFELVSAVDEYVFGFCLMERMNGPLEDDGAAPGPEFDEMRDYVDGLIATGDYPALAAIAESPGLEEAWTDMQRQITDPGRFDRSLQRLLDGFEAALGRSGARRRKR